MYQMCIYIYIHNIRVSKIIQLGLMVKKKQIYLDRWIDGHIYIIIYNIESIYIYMYVCLKLMGGLSQLAGLIAVAPPCGAMAEASHGRL